MADVIRDRHDAFDAILLDVDNGPSALSHASNDWLYSHAGLRAAHRALRDRGVLRVWSVAPDPGLTQRLGEAGIAAEEHVGKPAARKEGDTPSGSRSVRELARRFRRADENARECF